MFSPGHEHLKTQIDRLFGRIGSPSQNVLINVALENRMPHCRKILLPKMYRLSSLAKEAPNADGPIRGKPARRDAPPKAFRYLCPPARSRASPWSQIGGNAIWNQFGGNAIECIQRERRRCDGNESRPVFVHIAVRASSVSKSLVLNRQPRPRHPSVVLHRNADLSDAYPSIHTRRSGDSVLSRDGTYLRSWMHWHATGTVPVHGDPLIHRFCGRRHRVAGRPRLAGTWMSKR
jgi:hypothetical protein